MKKCKLVPIGSGENPGADGAFSNDLKYRQLNKIIAHRLFSRSPILCKFLCYVVNETLAGNANQIKEYTIAVNVLNKPKYFDTQLNGIVRIHAARLRRLLADYYSSVSGQDPVVISIPKGQYKPIFQPSNAMVPGVFSNVRYLKNLHAVNKDNLAILPFNTSESISARTVFTDSIGQQLSNELNRTTNFSIVSYSFIRELTQEQLKIHHIARKLKVKYVLSGDVHFETRNIRVFAQLTETSSLHQIWSDMYDLDSDFSGYFELSDIISSKITGSLRMFVSSQNIPGFSGSDTNRLSSLNKKTSAI